MNYAVIGDIHANIFALDACFNSLEQFQKNQDLKYSPL